MKDKLHYRMENVGKVHRLYLYDDIEKEGSFNWITWEYDESETSAKHFKEMLDSIHAGEEIELHFNTNGGSVSEGTTIKNLLEQHPAKVTGIVDGVCHSVGFTILQGCDTRIMREGTTALLHNPWVYIAGNARELREAADRLDATRDSCAHMYATRCNLTEEEVKDLMEKETMLTPQSALDYGFIDSVNTEDTMTMMQQKIEDLMMQVSSQRDEINKMKQAKRNEDPYGLDKFFGKE